MFLRNTGTNAQYTVFGSSDQNGRINDVRLLYSSDYEGSLPRCGAV